MTFRILVSSSDRVFTGPSVQEAALENRADSRASVPASRRAWGSLARTLLVASLAAPLPLSVTAQQDALDPGQMGRIIVRLVDAETSAPVPGAVVHLTTLAWRALSDSAGTAVFLDVIPGAHELTIRRIGYAERAVQVTVASAATAVIAVPLAAEAVAVAPIEVEIEQRPRYLEENGFYDRRAEAHGSFFDPMFVDRWGVGDRGIRADRFIDLLVDMTPQLSSMASVPASRGSWEASMGNGFEGQCPAIYVDGQRAFNDPGTRGHGRPSRELEMMSGFMIGAVEIYPSSHGLPYFALEPTAGCGAIVVWTDRWRGGERELGGGDVELCAPADSSGATVEGEIRDEFTGVLLPGAHVLARTYHMGRAAGTDERTVVADARGRYRVCDVPSDHSLTLAVTVAEHAGPEMQVPIEEGTVTRDLSIRLAGPGDLVGRVVDRSTGRPVATAEVAVAGTSSRGRTDELGYFRLDDVQPGDRIVEVSHFGFEPVAEQVSIVADRTVDLRVELSADPIALEPLVVTALRDRRLELRGFYDRRTLGERLGQGVFYEREDLEARALGSVSSVFREVPGLEVTCSGARNCQVSPSRRECERMSVFINGTLALGETKADDVGIDELVRPAEIAAMEVYTSAATVPADFTGMSGRCGAIVIWTG